MLGQESLVTGLTVNRMRHDENVHTVPRNVSTDMKREAFCELNLYPVYQPKPSQTAEKEVLWGNSVLSEALNVGM